MFIAIPNSFKSFKLKLQQVWIKHLHLSPYTDFSYEPSSIHDNNLPNGVGLNPDVGVAKRTLGLGVCLTGLPRVTVVFDRLVHCHVVRQESLTHEELQLVSGCSLTDEHSSL